MTYFTIVLFILIYFSTNLYAESEVKMRYNKYTGFYHNYTDEMVKNEKENPNVFFVDENGRNRLRQVGVSNCGYVAATNNLLSFGESPDNKNVKLMANMPFSSFSVEMMEELFPQYKTRFFRFSHQNFPDVQLDDANRVVELMKAGYSNGSCQYSITVDTTGALSDMEKLPLLGYHSRGGSYWIWETRQHGVAILSIKDGWFELDRYGRSFWIPEDDFRSMLGKNIVYVKEFSKAKSGRSATKKINTKPQRTPPKYTKQDLPLIEAIYRQATGINNCINIATANCCASITGKNQYTDSIAESIIGAEYMSLEFEKRFSIRDEFGQDLSACDPLKVFSSMIYGMKNGKRYFISTYATENFSGSTLDGLTDIRPTSDHAIYVEGFRLSNEGKTVMQLDYYGKNFYMTEKDFSSSLGHVIKDIRSITKNK